MAGFTLARIALDSPITFNEQWGDPVTNLGGTPVPAIRAAIRHSVDLPTFTSPVSEDSVARRLRARRQLRSLLNNAPYKMAGLFLSWTDDEEQNGWYIPDQGELVQGADGPLTTGYWDLQNFAWFKVGAPRTHRGAALLSIKDLRTGLTARDTLRRVYSEDFHELPALALTYLPAGASDVANNVTSEALAPVTLPAGRDGGATLLVANQTDLTVLSYETSEANRNLGDVVVYDQRGKTGLPAGAENPQAFGWEEIYGPDYPYTAGGVPVIENGRVRVVWDATNTPGFRVYVWNGTAYVEQGKMCFAEGFEATTLFSATVMEYTPNRAVLKLALSDFAKTRTVTIVTLQRGWSGPRFESVPASGSEIAARLLWTPAALLEDTSFVKINSGGGVDYATAGTGSLACATANLALFTGENELMILQQGGTVQHNLAVVVAGNDAYIESNKAAYGAGLNTVLISSEYSALTVYASVRLGFAVQQAQQIMEAELMTLGTGSTITTDALASNGKAVTATRTTDANAHVTQATWPNSDYGTYRVFARVKTSVGTSKWQLYAKTTGTTGATKEGAGTSYEWVDLGDIVAKASTLEIHAWLSAAGTVSVDRIEAVLVADQVTAHGGIYAGGRDLGQSALYDSRVTQTVVGR